MTDTLKRLAGPVGASGAAATVYTVPALTTTSITAIHVCNETGTLATFTMSIGADGANKRFFMAESVPGNDIFDWTGLLVLAAAEIIQIYSGTANSLTCTISGVEVS